MITAPRKVGVNVRIRPDDLELIDAAAKGIGKTRSQFIRDAAETEARLILRRPRPARKP